MKIILVSLIMMKINSILRQQLIVSIQIMMETSEKKKLNEGRANKGFLEKPRNILLSLKQKKKEILMKEKDIEQAIKQFYSNLTLTIHDKETSILNKLQIEIMNVMEKIDYYTSIDEIERCNNMDEICGLLDIQLGVTENTKLNQVLGQEFILLSMNGHQSKKAKEKEETEEREWKTSKKNIDSNFLIIKQSYMVQIEELQQKIQRLMLKEDKIKNKVTEMQSKIKMRKIGNSYLPVHEERNTPNLLVQRLQAENSILKEQISDSSQKILALGSQNSMLMREKDGSQVFSTEKKRWGNSIKIIEESLQIGAQIDEIHKLEEEMERMKKEIEMQRQKTMNCEQYYCERLEEKEKEKNEYMQIVEKLKEKIGIMEQENKRVQVDLVQESRRKEEEMKKLQGRWQDCQKRRQQMQQKVEEQKISINNYIKLLKLKQQKLGQLVKAIEKNQITIEEAEQRNRKVQANYTANVQSLTSQIKHKQAQIQNLKNLIKRQHTDKNENLVALQSKQERIFQLTTQVKGLEIEIQKIGKQKESSFKKDVNKIKKELKKQNQQEKNALNEQFKAKYGQIMEAIDNLKKEHSEMREKYDKKIKLHELRSDLFRQRANFQMKQMIEKVIKLNGKDKDKLFSIVQSYTESEVSLSTKTAQIKLLKQEIAALKKIQPKRQAAKNITEGEVLAQLQQFSKKLFTQKLQLQKVTYEVEIKNKEQQYQIALRQKQNKLDSLNQKVLALQKANKQMRAQLNQATPIVQTIEIRKIKQENLQKETKMESHIHSLRNNLSKIQNELCQVREELRVKKQLVSGLKKDIKQRQNQRQKIVDSYNQVVEECEKLKRSSKQANKKQAIFEQFKQKLISQTELSEEIILLKATIEDRAKQHRIELNKRDQQLRQLKINEESHLRKLKSMGSIEEENIQLKQKVKKNKVENDRKQTLIQHLKQKVEKSAIESISMKDSLDVEIKRLKKQLEIEKNKAQSYKAKFNKFQANNQLLKLTIQRIYDELSEKNGYMKDYQTLKTQAKSNRFQFTSETPGTGQAKSSGKVDLNKYREALSILEISTEDLELQNNSYKSNNARDFCSPILNKTSNQHISQNQIKLSKLLDIDEVDSKSILEIFSLILP